MFTKECSHGWLPTDWFMPLSALLDPYPLVPPQALERGDLLVQRPEPDSVNPTQAATYIQTNPNQPHLAQDTKRLRH
jgi:hypothetical protein